MAGVNERGQLIGAVASSVVLFVGGAVIATIWSARRRLGQDKKHKKVKYVPALVRRANIY